MSDPSSAPPPPGPTPAPHYPPPAPTYHQYTPPPRKKPRWGLVITGGVLMIIAAASFVLAPLALAPVVGGVVSSLGENVTFIEAGQVADVLVGEDSLGTWAVYAPLPDDPTTALTPDEADPGIALDLTVTGPNGPLVVTVPDVRDIFLNVGASGSEPTRWSVAEFKASRLGVYEVSNDSTVDVVVARPTEELLMRGFGEALPAGITAILVVIGAVIAGFIGLILLIVGLAWRRPVAPTQ